MSKKTTSFYSFTYLSIDLVEVVYYLTQVFYLLYGKSVTPAEGITLLLLNIIDSCIIRYYDIIS